MNSPFAVSIDDAAVMAGVGRSSLYEAIKEGALPLRKCGRRSLILVDDLRRWITSLPEANRPAERNGTEATP